jgi:hypothetical protein
MILSMTGSESVSKFDVSYGLAIFGLKGLESYIYIWRVPFSQIGP